jgi:hypothetical protein
MSDFNLHNFLTEHKLTRNSVLLENDNAPSFTKQEMRFFKPEEAKWNGEMDGLTPIVTYKRHSYKLDGPTDTNNIEREPGESSAAGDAYMSTDKLPGVWFKFSAFFEHDGDGYGLEDLLDLEDIEQDPVWEIDPDSEDIPDEEEFDFGDELDERDIKGKEERIVKALKKTGKYSKDDPELYRLAAGIMKKQKAMNEVQGEELSHDIALIGGTLKKIETMLDFGRDQDQDVEEGLQTVLNILINIQHKLETDTKDAAGLGGASQFYQMENILKQMGK